MKSPLEGGLSLFIVPSGHGSSIKNIGLAETDSASQKDITSKVE